MATSNPSASNPRPPGPAGGGSGFPLKTALAILVMVDALLGWRLYMDRGKGIDSGIFEETFRLRWPQQFNQALSLKYSLIKAPKSALRAALYQRSVIGRNCC